MVACNPGQEECTTVDTQFDFGIRLGLVFVVESAALSLIAVGGLLTYILYSVAKIKENAARRWATVTHVHWYFLSLLMSELVQAIGGIIDVRWIANAGVTEGHICTTQGALKQAGDVGVALASLAIALHTFVALVFRWRPEPSSKLPFIVITVIWVFLVLIVGLSLGLHKGSTYYGDTQYWCWITQDYPVQRIVLEYMWMWLTAFLNFILYVPIALVIIYDGTMVLNGFRIRFVKSAKWFQPDKRSQEKMLAMKMLVYPAVYTITVLPIAITRWMTFTGKTVPWAATVFSDVVFASSGFLNVLVFTITRPNLLPHRDSNDRPFAMNPRMSSPPPPTSSSISPYSHARNASSTSAPPLTTPDSTVKMAHVTYGIVHRGSQDDAETCIDLK